MFDFKRILSALIALSLVCTAYGDFDVIKDGKGLADIVISDKATRSAKLAAEELQANLFKMSGAKLPIVNTPGKGFKAHIYVGRSAETDKLKITDEGLKHGAFKMVSGPDWLVLLGNDREFAFKGPELKNANDQARLMAEWDKATGEHWEYPFSQIYKGNNEAFNLNEKDEFGSVNAVYEFLYLQGMRWYLPDPLGEIIPEKKTVSVPELNKTVKPDFELRYFYQYGRRFGQTTKDEILWQLRLGFNQAPDMIGQGYVAHGTGMLLRRDEVKKAHPEYYALIGGVRQNGEKYKPCLSSEELIQANVKFVRALFDIFDAPMVSVMPTDGFTAICQCDKCKDKATPECGWDGQFSDYVWEYVNRVAQEVYKTHPNKKIVSMAYTTYLQPPAKISKLSPNIVVCIAQGRTGFGQSPETRKSVEETRKGYIEKLPGVEKPLCQYEYYRWAVPGKGYQYMPAFSPHAIAADLHSLKGISFGDYIEVHREKGLNTMGVSHLNIYITGRYLWDADQDINKILEEYYTLFYGPARDEMKAFIEFSEANWKDMKNSAEKIGKAFELLNNAVKKTPADSVYAKRIAMISEYMNPLKALHEQLSNGRDKDNLPKLKVRLLETKDIVLDGKMDDVFWKGVPGYGSGVLKETKTGNAVSKDLQTTFKVGWSEGCLYVGVKCMEPDMKKLNVGTTKNEDGAIWQGDCVEILIETQSHSYYQIVVNPGGALMDVDRQDGIDTKWSSDAKVAAFKGDDYWSIEARIPIADEMQANIDSKNGLAGKKPDETFPWYINICRQRIHDGKSNFWSFSPSEKGFHDKMKFAQLGGRGGDTKKVPDSKKSKEKE